VPHANHSVGLRTVAALEAAKGILVLLLGFGVLALMHKNLDDVAERLTEILRVNPEGRLSSLFIHAANQATDKTLWMLAIGALVYATVRLVEAFGLWRGREWAQWFALLFWRPILAGGVAFAVAPSTSAQVGGCGGERPDRPVYAHLARQSAAAVGTRNLNRRTKHLLAT
jgi:uncharacterized membrane protein (DUF2068 family)